MLPWWSDVTIVQTDITIVVPCQLSTGTIDDYLFCYCPLVGILFEVLRIYEWIVQWYSSLLWINEWWLLALYQTLCKIRIQRYCILFNNITPVRGYFLILAEHPCVVLFAIVSMLLCICYVPDHCQTWIWMTSQHNLLCHIMFYAISEWITHCIF